MPNTISLKLAKRLALHASLIHSGDELPTGKNGVLHAIEHLGYVQIDTISVIRRAHHHTLWSRCSDYQSDMLQQLQANDRKVFEYWGHAASYLPMSDFRYYLPQMRSFRNPQNKWIKNQLKISKPLITPVLERIRKEGALGSKDFKHPDNDTRDSWWGWKPAKAALEMLFWQGELMITERRNFQRIYDLTERVLPEDVNTSHPDDTELGRFLVRRALNAYGVAQEREIKDHIVAIEHPTKTIISKTLNEMLVTNEIVRIKIPEIEADDYYALPETIETTEKLEKAPPYVHILSPFDNLVMNRKRIKELFDFEYTLEAYTPPAKRVYGYFVLPILWNETLVGRLDVKADRKRKILTIRNLVFEPIFKDFDRFPPIFKEQLQQFAQFNGCDDVIIEKISPSNLTNIL
jgi:uncharacterized protein YcaQ